MRILALLTGLLLAGCGGPPEPSEYVVRLGQEALTNEELSEALSGLTVEMDSADAAHQVVEQWVTNQLLFAEARRRGLDRNPEVLATIRESERSVVVDALLSHIYNEVEAGPTEQEVQEYFQRNQERLRLVEPYVRIRYLVTDSLAPAQEARRELVRLAADDEDGWRQLVSQVSDEPSLSLSLATSLVPETRAFAEYPPLGAAVVGLQVGRTTPVIADRGLYHVVQILERVPEGTIPERAWIEGALRQQLQMESRKLLYARLVQRLRNEALSREQLDIR